MRIFGWLADTQGCGHIRIEQPLTALRTRGHTTACGTQWDGRQRSISVRPDPITRRWRTVPAGGTDPDVVIGGRIARSDPSILWRAACAAGRSLCVYEIDDDLFHVDPSSKISYAFFSRPDIRRNILTNLQLAHRVVTSTDHLGELLSTHHPDVRVVPNSVPGWMLELPSTARTDGIITVGWAGSATHAMDWEVARRPLASYLATAKGVELHTIGADHARRLGLYRSRWRHTRWFARTPDYWRALDFHIGLAPLADHPFNHAKSPIKALEYAARGIPVIASDVGPYRAFVRHGETGFLVRHPEEWVTYLKVLVADHGLRERMGAAARALAAEHTIERRAPVWEAALTPGRLP